MSIINDFDEKLNIIKQFNKFLGYVLEQGYMNSTITLDSLCRFIKQYTEEQKDYYANIKYKKDSPPPLYSFDDLLSNEHHPNFSPIASPTLLEEFKYTNPPAKKPSTNETHEKDMSKVYNFINDFDTTHTDVFLYNNTKKYIERTQTYINSMYIY
jgi:hypothetical protein